jgi:acyl-CoA synthetase (AMP-forming)/AMP-acid ligase II/acyl carrier protein
LYFSSSLRSILSAAAVFDKSVEDMFSCFCAGCTLVIPDCHLADATALIHTINRQHIDHTFFVPTMFAKMHTEHEIPSCLNLLELGGEGLTYEVLSGVRDDILCLNAYGPAETIIISTVFEIDTALRKSKTSGPVPIGKPLPSHSVFVLDDNMHLLPRGFPGELYIGGPCLARGYLGQPTETAMRFVANPFGPGKLYRTGDLVRWQADGNLVFLGRVDFQVKLRGQRIELGEIETVARGAAGVSDAVAVVRGEGNNARILCFVVAATAAPLPTDGASSTPATPNLEAGVLAACKEKLPVYMVPSRVIMLTEWPRTASGKIDRKQLVEPSLPAVSSSVTMEQSFTTVQSLLADLWMRLMSVPRTSLSLDSNFFECGGHSLLAVSLASEIKRQLRIPISATTIMLHPTIGDLANCLASASFKQAGSLPGGGGESVH